MKALIVDDERLARKELMKLLEEHPSIEIVGEAQNADEAEQMITELNPDLLFLDIEMPGLNGFKVVEQLASKDELPQVIFVTAYDQYAIKAFQVHAVDYLAWSGKHSGWTRCNVLRFRSCFGLRHCAATQAR